MPVAYELASDTRDGLGVVTPRPRKSLQPTKHRKDEGSRKLPNLRETRTRETETE